MKSFLPKNYPHGLIYYDEYDLLLRESTIKLITSAIKKILRTINSAIKFIQIETPTLIPAEYLSGLFNDYIGIEPQDKLPHYSNRTTDLYLDQHEIVGISNRTDFDFSVLEIACGLDRICALLREKQ